jgi:hypothetical protein
LLREGWERKLRLKARGSPAGKQAIWGLESWKGARCPPIRKIKEQDRKRGNSVEALRDRPKSVKPVRKRGNDWKEIGGLGYALILLAIVRLGASGAEYVGSWLDKREPNGEHKRGYCIVRAKEVVKKDFTEADIAYTDSDSLTDSTVNLTDLEKPVQTYKEL